MGSASRRPRVAGYLDTLGLMATVSPTPSFVCPHCGKTHVGWPTDQGYTLPDDVWAISEPERAARAKWTTDLCQMGERRFIRGLLQIPFTDQPGYFGWGLWVELDPSAFHRYLAVYDKDGASEPPENGRIANQLPGYDLVLGAEVSVHFRDSTQRPLIRFPGGAPGRLAREQVHGIDATRYHEILAAVGAIEP